MSLLDHIKWNPNGLAPMILQDETSREVLMLGWVNTEALAKTIETKTAHFWSRSRKKLWKKGESSGHVQIVKELRLDCDADVILAMVESRGPACHKGYRSCFFRRLEPLGPDGELVTLAEREFDPGEVYGGKATGGIHHGDTEDSSGGVRSRRSGR